MTSADRIGTPSAGAVAVPEAAAEIVARIERVPTTGFHTRARVIVGSATFFDGFDSLSISYVLPVLIGLWKIAPVDSGLLISMGYVGGIIGAFFFGWVAERWGRMPSLLMSVVVFAVFSILCALSTNFTMLLIFRTIQGAGLAGEIPVAATYINELAHARDRGRFALLYQLVYAVGMVVVAAAGNWIVPNLGWASLFYIGAIPAIVALVMRFSLPESPRWLANQGRYKEADAIMGKIELEATKGDLGKLPPLEIKPVVVEKTRFQEILQGIYLKRTIVVWVIFFCVYMVNFTMTTWTPSIYTSVLKVPLAQALQYSLITQFVGLLGTFTAAMVIDHVGRRPLFTVSFGAATVCMAVLWLLGATTAEQIVVLVTISYYFISILSISLWLYTPEIYPTRMRAVGSSMGIVAIRIASVIGPMFVGMVVASYALSVVYGAFAVFVLIGTIVSLFLMTETKGQLLEKLSP